MQLHYDLVSAAGATPTRRVVFLHGILGSGANLRSHARRFVDARPPWQAVLVDLRAHGRSLGTDGRPDTLEVAAADVVETLDALPSVPSVPLRAAVGHSFGGKVALQLASLVTLEHVVTLDSGPGTRLDARGSEATLGVLQMLAALRGPWDTRDAFLREVQAAGQPLALAQWLAMNLDRRDEGLFFRLDLSRIDALLRSYLASDLWPVVEATQAQVHLVISGRSSVYVAEDQARAHALEGATQGRVTVDVLDAGHWVHVDDPDGVQRVLLQRT
jgi:esterase